MTDELFDYFGKGSKKFEPLDDDLDLPEVSPKRRDDTQDNAVEPEFAETPDELPDDIALPAETETVVVAADDDDVFAGFGAGLFDDSTDELPPRKQVAKVKPTAPKQAVKKEGNPEPKAKTAIGKPAASNPRDEEVAAVDRPDEKDDSEGGTWDFIAGVLGIGGKKSKTDDDAADQQRVVGDKVSTSEPKDTRKSSASKKDQPKADVKSYFQEPKPAPEAAVDALFNTANDGLDLVGWGDEEDDDDVDVEEKPVAAKSANVERPSRSGRDRDSKPAIDDRENRSRSSRAKAPVVNDLVDDDIDDDDENFIEFEVEELTPSAREKKDAPSSDGPRRRRRPARKTFDDDPASEDAPRPRSRSDRDEVPSESRSSGRGRSRGRGRGRNQSEDRDTQSRKPVAKVDADLGDDDWRDDQPAADADSEQRSERSRGSRGRGRGRGRNRPDRQERDSKPFEDDSLDDELEISSFVDDEEFDTDAEEAPKKSGRSRRPRSRSRGRGRSENNRDDSDQDSFDSDSVDLDSANHDSPDRENAGRGSSGRGRRNQSARNDRGRDSESSPRRGRGSRDNRDRDDSPDEKPPVYAEVPTWDETIESMIESNIKNHESNSNRGRSGGGGRGRGGNNRNSNSRNRR